MDFKTTKIVLEKRDGKFTRYHNDKEFQSETFRLTSNDIFSLEFKFSNEGIGAATMFQENCSLSTDYDRAMAVLK